MEYHNEKYRIKRNKLHAERMKYLIDNKIFASYSDILAISAIVGYNNERFKPIESQAQDPVQLSFFTDKERRLILLLAYAHTKEQSILSKDNDKKYHIFESYANGGFPILWDHLGCDVNEEIIDISEIFMKLSLGLELGIKVKDVAEDIFV